MNVSVTKGSSAMVILKRSGDNDSQFDQIVEEVVGTLHPEDIKVLKFSWDSVGYAK